MTTIPDDVMNAAKDAARRSVERPYNAGTMKRATDIIARAIMAERERCATVADAHSECERDCGDVIAAAIRKGE
jgi:hypothetical protein